MSASSREGRSGGENLRTHFCPCRVVVTERYGEKLTITEVPYGGDPRPQLLPGVDAHACQRGAGIFLCHRFLRLVVGVEGKVYVRVDEPGQQRGITEIQDVQVC
uniref:Uncharacterized protein n=1 Tax=Streptomyces auratus AGR0001 TaxID=1160718 RepID=J2JSF2_9ACTN